MNNAINKKRSDTHLNSNAPQVNAKNKSNNSRFTPKFIRTRRETKQAFKADVQRAHAATVQAQADLVKVLRDLDTHIEKLTKMLAKVEIANNSPDENAKSFVDECRNAQKSISGIDEEVDRFARKLSPNNLLATKVGDFANFLNKVDENRKAAKEALDLAKLNLKELKKKEKAVPAVPNFPYDSALLSQLQDEYDQMRVSFDDMDGKLGRMVSDVKVGRLDAASLDDIKRKKLKLGEIQNIGGVLGTLSAAIKAGVPIGLAPATRNALQQAQNKNITNGNNQNNHQNNINNQGNINNQNIPGGGVQNIGELITRGDGLLVQFRDTLAQGFSLDQIFNSIPGTLPAVQDFDIAAQGVSVDGMNVGECVSCQNQIRNMLVGVDQLIVMAEKLWPAQNNVPSPTHALISLGNSLHHLIKRIEQQHQQIQANQNQPKVPNGNVALNNLKNFLEGVKGRISTNNGCKQELSKPTFCDEVNELGQRFADSVGAHGIGGLNYADVEKLYRIVYDIVDEATKILPADGTKSYVTSSYQALYGLEGYLYGLKSSMEAQGLDKQPRVITKTSPKGKDINQNKNQNLKQPKMPDALVEVNNFLVQASNAKTKDWENELLKPTFPQDVEKIVRQVQALSADKCKNLQREILDMFEVVGKLEVEANSLFKKNNSQPGFSNSAKALFNLYEALDDLLDRVGEQEQEKQNQKPPKITKAHKPVGTQNNSNVSKQSQQNTAVVNNAAPKWWEETQEALDAAYKIKFAGTSEKNFLALSKDIKEIRENLKKMDATDLSLWDVKVNTILSEVNNKKNVDIDKNKNTPSFKQFKDELDALREGISRQQTFLLFKK